MKDRPTNKRFHLRAAAQPSDEIAGGIDTATQTAWPGAVLPSGATHDAWAMSELCPMAMSRYTMEEQHPEEFSEAGMEAVCRVPLVQLDKYG